MRFLEDEELRNVIDRLAEFVAKNGMEFEERTRNKRFGDPRFTFLFGGQFADYYRFRVMQESQKCNFFLFFSNVQLKYLSCSLVVNIFVVLS